MTGSPTDRRRASGSASATRSRRLSGLWGAVTALYNRETNGGRGQVVDVAIYEAVLALMESTIPEYALAGHVRGRTGAILPFVAPSNTYPTREGD